MYGSAHDFCAWLMVVLLWQLHQFISSMYQYGVNSRKQAHYIHRCRNGGSYATIIAPIYTLTTILVFVSHEKTISGGARKAIFRSLDSAASSLLALISREYAQLV